MSIDPRTPCLVGTAQRTWRPDDLRAGDIVADAPEPLEMWEEVCRAAVADSGASVDRVLDALDSLQVVYCQTWQYDDPPGRLADALGASPGHSLYSGIGGTTPQVLVNDTARRMLDGDLELALICGAEALATKRRMKRDDRRPAWRFRPDEKRPFPLEAPFLPTEIAHEVFQAWLTFPVWDLARRAARHEAPHDYAAAIGDLMAPMTRVAAANPHAWFPVERKPTELSTPTAENRVVGYPYTKYEVAVMDVDMAGALVVATHAKADELGVPPEQRVYLRGWCYASDPTYLAEHHDYTRSPAMAAASREALARAGVGIDDVAHLDVYSCFASSLHFAQDALGLGADDGRSLTVTGGLPFAGGPASNYLTHALSTMADRLRDDPGSLGLLSGVGMHMTKHVYAVYSTQPPEEPLRPPDEEQVQRELDAAGHRAVVEHATGPARVATYSVAHRRDGEPDWGLAICDLPDGDRCYARVEDPQLLREIETVEWVGAEVDLVAGEADRNLVRA